MKLAPKLALYAILIVGLTMSVIGYYLISEVRSDMTDQLLEGLHAQTGFAQDAIQEESNHIGAITQVIAKLREIPKALDLYESRGVNQILNDQISVYPFINYILITEADGVVFATSTRDSEGNKTSGERLLLKETLTNALMTADRVNKVNIGPVGIDANNAIIGVNRHYSQWYQSDILKRGEVVGGVVVSIDWSKIHTELLDQLVAKLIDSKNSVKYAFISDENGKVMAVNSISSDVSVDTRYVEKEDEVRSNLAVEIGGRELRINLVYGRSESFEPIHNMTKTLVVGALLGSILLGVVFFMLLRSAVLSRVNILHRSMNEIGQGDLNHRVPELGKDEIADLGNSINKMVSNLKEKTTSIEDLNEEAALRKRALMELDEQRFAQDQHSIVAVTDIKGTITYVNELFCEISGYSSEELIGNNHRILKSDYHDEDFFRKMYLTISKGKVWNAEICNRAKQGNIYWVDTTIVPFMDAEGKPRSYIAIRNDITARKEYEKELVEAKVVADGAAKAKSEFLASMSHEIRTPMNGVIGMLNLLNKTGLDDIQQRQAQLALSSAEALLVLINDILDFSKIEAGKLDIENIEFDLRQLFGSFSESHAIKAADKRIELIVDTREITQSHVSGDPGRLRQILNNLVSNALKFTDSGDVVIRASLMPNEHDERLTLKCSVTDSGIGILPEQLDSLFDQFTQADSSTTRKYGGTGLGLSICKQLCELMDGEIRATSAYGQGSCFEIEVKLAPCDKETMVLPQVDVSELNILIVDDNKTNCEVLEGQLALWGANVSVATSASEALEILREIYATEGKPKFDLAILDMQMPGTDGAELGSRIRADKQYDDLKLVMMTSMTNRGDAKYFANLGFQGYFPKPVTTDDLFQALAVVSEGGEVLHRANPLVTSHYIHQVTGRDEQILARLKECQGRVLLVEDNVVNQEVAKANLLDLGLSVDIAANGLEAIDLLRTMATESNYDLVLMDCQMPEMDGYQATEAIRQGKAGHDNEEIPIIAMTANAMMGGREKCLDAGMNDYLTKPIDPRQLSKKLFQWLIPTPEETPVDEQGPESVQELEQKSKQESEPALKLSVWNRESALQRMLGKEVLLRKLVVSCMKDMPNLIEKLDEAVKQRNSDEVRNAAHSIKGSSANLSAEILASYAQEIEASGKNGDLENLDKQMNRLLTAWEELQIQLTDDS